VSGAAYEVVHLDELESFPIREHGLRWRPIRSRLGIQAFGMNAWTATQAGDEVVEDHTEETYGHEEVYTVVAGRARFTVDGDKIDAPVGTIVHLPDPKVRRAAVALEPHTTVLAVGGIPGEAFRPSSWELFFRAARLPPHEAVRVLEDSEGYNVETANYQYNLACFLSLAGRREEAVAAFRRAFELALEPVSEWAAGDSDLDPIRDEVSAIAGKANAAGPGS
jgi:quercetin dioxygenase-like cupin family protein